MGLIKLWIGAFSFWLGANIPFWMGWSNTAFGFYIP